MNRTILIIGAGIEQIEAYVAAKSMGLTVVGSDMDPNAPAFVHADHKIIASTRDAEESVREVLAFAQNHPIHGVITIANDVPTTVSRVATALGLECMPIESTQIVSNKMTMKTLFDRHAISTPRFASVETHDDVTRFVQKHGLPIVLKPVDGRGSRGVLILKNTKNLEWAIDHAKQNSDSDQIMVEQFIAGLQYSTETIVYRGKCTTLSISERNYDLLDQYAPYVVENGGVIPAPISRKEHDEIHDLIVKIASALNIVNGTIKGDIIMTPEGPLVIEVALRLSGGYLSSVQIPLTQGVDLVTQTIKMALGDALNEDDIVPQNKCYLGIRYFFPTPGTIRSIEGFEELGDLDWVVRKKLYLGVGDVVEIPSNHTKRAGYVFVIGDSREQAEQRVLQAVAQVVIKTVP